ncbi:uncharacterized protein N0V89_009350 [Didymosphaeria variabile]|uniref:Protein kinase domain-containing protein n=1 Tax=Didymosphaeria variabile TaxID=1932322 RepID=A0A9W8XFD9_9PLEO|nr:uncharacterized protein N0V89_009350 [Didymosphaeria variabile]KAJ4347978.1 hypothetical protein N0V89_009350 [Didymosphaeria variabile]
MLHVEPTPFQRKQNELKERLDWAKREDSGHFYIPLGEVERILSESALRLLIRYYDPQCSREDLSNAVCLLLERQPHDDLAAYRYLRVFATLIHCGNETYIERAIQYFLSPIRAEQPESKIWRPPEDVTLPTNDAEDIKAFYNNLGIERHGFYDHFFERKKRFCALVLKEGGRHEVSQDVILPFSINDDDLLGEGGAGKVFKVKVGKRHWVDKWLSNPEDMLLAIKRFNPPTTDKLKDRFENEFPNLMRLKHASIKSENVMLPLASLKHGQQRYLIYDLAENHLGDYMAPTNAKYVFTKESTKTVLKNATDLVGALKWIHQYKPYHSVWHNDIKPENILILRDSSREIWKLADFDRSLAKATLSASGTELRPKDEHSYRSPDRKRGKRGDVWSMACMITLVLSWLADGPHGIGEFTTLRNNGNPEAPDVFYEWNNPESQNLNPGVQKWLVLLCGKAKQMAEKPLENGEADDFSSRYSKYVENVIGFLKRRAFVAWESRAHSDEFYTFMDKEYSQIPNTDFMEPETVKESEEISPTRIESTWDEFQTASRALSPQPQRASHDSESQRTLALRTRNLSTLSTPISAKTATTDPLTGITTRECSPLCSAIGRKVPPDEIPTESAALNDPCPKCGDIPIHKAIRKDSEAWVRKLLANKKTKRELKCDKGGSCNPLTRSGKEGRLWAAKLLIDEGCRDIDYNAIKSHTLKDKIKKYIKDVEKGRR